MPSVATQATATTSPNTGIFVATGLTILNGSPIITVGDVFICDGHGDQTVIDGSTVVKDLNGNAMAWVGSHTSCSPPETIITGEPAMELRG